MREKIKEAARYIQEKGANEAEVGLVLGSGLGEIVERFENAIHIPYEEIPHFPVSTVVGHASELVYGELNGRKVLAMAGRFHYYEGYKMEQVIFPIRVIKAMGIEKLMITNAAGGINWDFQPGDLMVICDQLNMTGTNPLLGPNDNELGPRFIDMSEPFAKDYIALAKEKAAALNIDLKEGVYMGVTGPTYETPAEIRMFRTLGADAVGMSTVSEVIAARHLGMKVMGLSCITNLGSGMQENIDHSAVVNTVDQVKEHFQNLVANIIEEM